MTEKLSFNGFDYIYDVKSEVGYIYIDDTIRANRAYKRYDKEQLKKEIKEFKNKVNELYRNK